jgi:hypothetical protein
MMMVFGGGDGHVSQLDLVKPSKGYLLYRRFHDSTCNPSIVIHKMMELRKTVNVSEGRNGRDRLNNGSQRLGTEHLEALTMFLNPLPCLMRVVAPKACGQVGACRFGTVTC